MSGGLRCGARVAMTAAALGVFGAMVMGCADDGGGGAGGGDDPCAVCADEDRCVRGAGAGVAIACEPLCAPPRLLRFSRLPLGAALPLEPGVEVRVDEGDWREAAAVTLERLGTREVQARWRERPATCTEDVIAVVRYTVVERLAGSGEAAGPEDAVAADDARISAWASGWVRPGSFGSDLDAQWTDVARALGPATGDVEDAVSLGNGGALTFTFDAPIRDRSGPDLAVFENGFGAGAGASFLELAWVEVSSDGIHFARFPSLSFQVEAVAAYGTLDASEVVGVAGRWSEGLGTAFDLAHLADDRLVLTGRVLLDAIRYVRVVDIVGDGSARDSAGAVLFDPSPTFGPAGFDVEAIAVLGGEEGTR